MDTDIESPVLARVRSLIEPIAADLGLDLYDLEQRGGTLRITLDTPPGSAAGVTLDTLSLASRLVSKELDQHDPVPSRYTLEVTSPGVERALRHPAHFRREVGKLITIRLADVPRAEPGGSSAADRRLQGFIVAADEHSVTVRSADETIGGAAERVIAYSQIDRARTVFEWGPQPKPGTAKPKRVTSGDASSADREPHRTRSENESTETGPRRSGVETRLGTAAAPAASPAATSKETGPRRSGVETRLGTAAAPAASPAATSKETGPRRSGVETRLGTAAAPAASPAATSEERTS